MDTDSRIRASLVRGMLCALAACAVAACSGDDTTPNLAKGGSGGSAQNEAGGSAGSVNATGGNNNGGSGGGSGGSAGNNGGGAGTGGMAGSGAAGGAGSMDAGSNTSAEGGDGGPKSCKGNAVSFNANSGGGNDQAKAEVQVAFGNSDDLPTGNTLRTIEYWAYVLKSSWAGDANTMFFYGTNNRNADGFGLDFGGSPGQIDPFTNALFDNDNQPTGLDASKDQWVHFAMTWDGMAVRAFVNGEQKAIKMSDSATQKVLMTGRTALHIGSYPSAYFNGMIDEFRIWNVNHTAEDIKKTMNKTLVGNEPGLVGYWKFDETSGTTAADSVTTAGHMAHNGTLMAASQAQLPTWVPGVPTLECP